MTEGIETDGLYSVISEDWRGCQLRLPSGMSLEANPAGEWSRPGVCWLLSM